MRRFVHLMLALAILLGLHGPDASATAQYENVLDLANIPLTVQEVPEDGYQVMSGGYLASDEIAGFIADPRNLDQETVAARLNTSMPMRVYVLNLVLPEDRAWQESPPLALHQTTVYQLPEEADDTLVELLLDHSNVAWVDEAEPAVSGATSVYWVGEAGEQIRTVWSDGDLVLEIVSLDATGEPDATEHALVVEGTIERLRKEQSAGSIGLSSMAFSVVANENRADYFNAQQTGVHGIYRYRDNAVQPALGEIEADNLVFAPGMEAIYLTHNLVETGGGVAAVSVSLFEFDDAEMVLEWYESLIEGSPQEQLVDPYFTFAENESWTEQGVLGVYRATGTYNDQAYSGYVQIRQQGEVVVAVGYRVIGASIPDGNIASDIMDHQLECLEAQVLCPPFELVIETALPEATPITDVPQLGSVEFGWYVPELDSQWIVDEQFSSSGYDRLGLRNGVSIFELESVINHHGDPVQCVLDELDLLEEFEQHSVITVWEDADGNTEGGNTTGQAWIVYRVEPLAEERADQEYVMRIDCFSLVDGSANLVVKHITPVDFWNEEQEKGTFLRDVIVIPESNQARGKLAASAHDRRTTMINFHWIDRAA